MAQLDQLLEEYLRVINAKDGEIHELIRVLEELRCEGKKKDEAHKSHAQKISNELDKVMRKAKKLEQKNRTCEDQIDKLVKENEALSIDFQKVQHSLMDAEKIIEENKRAHETALEELQQTYNGMVSKFSTEREELKAHQSELQKELEEALKSVDECRLKEEEIRKLEVRIAALTQSVEDARGEMQSMVPAERVKQIVSEHEEELRTVRKACAEEFDEVSAQLSDAQKSGRKMKEKLKELKESYGQLKDKLDETTCELEEVRKLRQKEQETHNEVRSRQQEEIEQAIHAAKSSTEKLCAMTGQLRQCEVDAQTMEQRWKEVSATLEQERSRNTRDREQMNSQLEASQAQVTEIKAEMSRLRVQLEQGATKLKECQDALASSKEASSRAAADSRESIALIASDRDRLKEDRDRVAFELKEAEHRLSMERDRASDAKRELSRRLDDAAHTIERMRDQLKDKEHQLQLLSTAHEKKIQELAFEHNNKLGDCKSQKKNAIDDVRRQLEAANLRLTEEMSGNKALQCELNSAREALANVRDECERWAKEAKESARRQEAATSEASSLRTSLAKQQELLAAAAEREKTLCKVAEHANAEKEMEIKRRELLERALEDTKREVVARRDEVQELRTRIDKENNNTLAKELLECEARFRESQRSLERTQREMVDVQRCGETLQATNKALEEKCRVAERSQREVEEELRRLKGEILSKERECARVAQHAREAEDAAKQSCEHMEREITQRETTIAALQQEISALSEERTKVALLEERMQHQVDMARRDSDNLQARVEFLEREVQDREEKIQQKHKEMLQTVDRLQTLQERAVELEEAMAPKERKHTMRKEALRKALQQVDEVNKLRSELERHLEKVKASREEESRIYKAQIHQQDERMRVLLEKHREMERQLVAQERDLKAAANEQMTLQQRLAVIRDREQVNVGKHSEEQQKMQEKLDAMSSELARAHATIKSVEEEKNNSVCEASDVQRRTAVNSNRLLITYADDALMTKEMFGEFAISIATRLLRGVNSIANKGCDSALLCMREYTEEAEKQQLRLKREIDDLKYAHAERVRKLEEENSKEMAKQAQHHAAELAKLRQELSDASARAGQEIENQLKDYRRKEEQFHREKTELECARVEMAHQMGQISSLKDQLRTLEQRMDTERIALEQEKRVMQQQYDRASRRLDECATVQSQSEVELRELRSELTNAQQALHEKEKALLVEREKNSQAVYQLEAVNTAKEMLYTQLNDANRKALNIKQQLLSARQEAQQATAAATAERQRLEERISDLAKAVSAHDMENRRLDGQIRSDEKKFIALERELAESRKREAEMSCQLQARRLENSSLRERCANLESLKNINDVTLAETRMREKDLFEKIEEMRSAQQLMQLCFDKQQEQLEAGRRMHEEDTGTNEFMFGGVD